MTYALITAEPMPEQGRLPDSATLLSDPGKWITGLQYQSAEVQQSTGWYQVVTTPRPADTDTHTFTRSLTLVGGVPTETWTQRAWTAEELAAQEAAANAETLTDPVSLQQRIDELKTYRADADVVATTNQTNNVAAPTQQLNRYNKATVRQFRRLENLTIALARLLDPSLLDDISDTTGGT